MTGRQVALLGSIGLLCSSHFFTRETKFHHLGVHGFRVFWTIRSHLSGLVVRQISLGRSSSSIAFKRKALAGPPHQLHSRERFFLEAATSRNSQVHRKLIVTDVTSWIQKLSYTLLPAYVHIAWKNCCKLLTLPR